MSPATVFGPIFVATQLESAVMTLLKKWFPTYLREVERQVGWDKKPLDAPAYYTNRTDWDIQPGEKMPRGIVVSPGLYEAPSMGDAGEFYNATWQIAVGVCMAARTEELADWHVKMYGAAVRAMMSQHQSLEGTEGIVGVHWLDESYDDLRINDKIGLYKAAASLFAIRVESVVSRWGSGPILPIEEAQTEEEVLTADATINKIPITQEIP